MLPRSLGRRPPVACAGTSMTRRPITQVRPFQAPGRALSHKPKRPGGAHWQGPRPGVGRLQVQEPPLACGPVGFKLPVARATKCDCQRRLPASPHWHALGGPGLGAALARSPAPGPRTGSSGPLGVHGLIWVVCREGCSQSINMLPKKKGGRTGSNVTPNLRSSWRGLGAIIRRLSSAPGPWPPRRRPAARGGSSPCARMQLPVNGPWVTLNLGC
jgi:hypothetical protein